MHIPDKWKMEPINKLYEFIHSYGFGTMVSTDLNASHLPLLLRENDGVQGVLYGHFARANSHWKNLEGEEVLIVFSGPHAYISPTWYEQQPSVPTWNYSAVHVKGVVELVDDDKTADILEETIKKYEPSLLKGDGFIPPEYKNKLAKGIVGFKIVIQECNGKEKLGQHRSIEDQKSVFCALNSTSNPDAKALQTYMKKYNIGVGG